MRWDRATYLCGSDSRFHMKKRGFSHKELMVDEMKRLCEACREAAKAGVVSLVFLKNDGFFPSALWETIEKPATLILKNAVPPQKCPSVNIKFILCFFLVFLCCLGCVSRLHCMVRT